MTDGKYVNKCWSYCLWLGIYNRQVTGPAKINHVSVKLPIIALLYHNLIISYTSTTKSLRLLQDLMKNLQKQDTTKISSKNITWCNICTHMVGENS